MAIYTKYETYLLKFLLSLQDVYWDDLSTNLFDQLCPVHQIVCSVVTLSTCKPAELWPFHAPACLAAHLLPVHQPRCSVENYPPCWLHSYDMSTSMTAQLWPVHQPVCSVWSAAQFTCFKAPQVFKCNYHFYQHVFIYIWVKWEMAQKKLSSAVAYTCMWQWFDEPTKFCRTEIHDLVV